MKWPSSQTITGIPTWNILSAARSLSMILLDLTLSVPTQAEAETIANNWAKKNQEVYALIMSNLL